MSKLTLVVLFCLSSFVYAEREGAFYYGHFPKDFVWASATSAYQIEGGWNADGKGPSIWDTRTATPGNIANNDNGNVACDSYHKYKEDVQLLKNMKVSHYRFSISWPRILPDGTTNNINQKGIDYYNNLINELIANNIQPMITLYHWDLPQALEDQGGWLNETTNEHFRKYAKLCFEKFGDRTKFWITFNEPWIVSWLGYGVAVFAPGKYSPGINVYKVSHNLIKAHAMAYHEYNDNFRATQRGKIGITLNCGWSEPKDPNNANDIAASNRAIEFDLGWFAHPIFVNGDYPDVMKWRVWQKSMLQNRTESRLPTFTDDEKKFIKGTSDFFGLNFYSSGLVETEIQKANPPSYGEDKDTKGSSDPNWLGSGSGWLKVTPWGIRKMLVWIKEHYGNPDVYVTENGVSDKNGSLADDHRIYFYKHYINEMLKAIRLHNCSVKGYTAWSLMDNFEWGAGYTERFGLHYVNFSDPERPRIPKASSRYYAQLITENGFKDPHPTVDPKNASVAPTINTMMLMLCVTIKFAVGIVCK